MNARMKQTDIINDLYFVQLHVTYMYTHMYYILRRYNVFH